MITLIFQIGSLIFLIISAIFIILYFKIRKELSSTKNKLNLAIKDIIPYKNGYYIETITLTDKNDPNVKEDYKCNVYVNEIDRYKNGTSKIELLKIEVISGYRIDRYEYIKKCIISQFSTLKKTSEIEWLESEDAIKELRKQKLEKLGIK